MQNINIQNATYYDNHYIYHKANYDFKPTNNDELDLSLGEYVLVHKRNHFEGGWWYGIKLEPLVYNNPVISGWFPSNHVEHDANVNSYANYLKAVEKEMLNEAPPPPYFSTSAETSGAANNRHVISSLSVHTNNLTNFNQKKLLQTSTSSKKRREPPKIPTSTSTRAPPRIAPRKQSLQRLVISKLSSEDMGPRVMGPRVINRNSSDLTETLPHPHRVPELGSYNGRLAPGSA
jgi:hypothetical protein